jgi:hypothetical protein
MVTTRCWLGVTTRRVAGASAATGVAELTGLLRDSDCPQRKEAPGFRQMDARSHKSRSPATSCRGSFENGEYMTAYIQTSEQLIRQDPEVEIIASAQRRDKYPIFVCQDESAAVRRLCGEIDGRQVALITDDSVARLHAGRLAHRLVEAGLNVAMTSFPEGGRFLPTEGGDLQRRVLEHAGWSATAGRTG